MKYYMYCDLPVGTLGIGEDGVGICRIFLPGTVDVSAAAERETPLLLTAACQLREYFDGTRTAFSLPLSLSGTPFQKRVWEALCSIPYGESRSYGELARMIGAPKACRAVGMANHRNPVMIVVPCHRVIGKDGALTGYAGGLTMKKALLDREGICYKERNGYHV